MIQYIGKAQEWIDKVPCSWILAWWIATPSEIEAQREIRGVAMLVFEVDVVLCEKRSNTLLL